jgi:hypothetical protein
MSFFSSKLTALLCLLIIGVLIWNHNPPLDQTPTLEAQSPLPNQAVLTPAPSPAEAPSPAIAQAPPLAQTATAIPAVVSPIPALTSPHPPTENPVTLLDISEDLSAVDSAIRNFHAVLGENPVGSNAEITSALLGNNLKQIKLEIPAGSQLNSEGQMCDRWGTPYFFHQVSAAEMEIRSAGPDRQMWTGDDSQL